MQALLCGYYGMGNGGDEALLAALLQMLPDQVTPIVLSGNPIETQERYGVEAVPRKSLRAVFLALWRADAFIWGGGSLMQDASSVLNPLYYAGLMLLAQLMGKRTIAWAQGIGPLNHWTSRLLTRLALMRCEAVSVRDRNSAALLSSWKRSCLLAPDPVWALDYEPVKGLWDLPAPRVVVALRPHSQLSVSRLDAISQALERFQRATGVCLLLVPFQPSRDLAIAEHIASHLSGPHYIYRLDQPRQIKGLFRGVEMTVGMRFHALVMSAAEGCRSFAISYDPKVDALAQSLDLPGWDLSAHPTVLPLIPEDPSRLAKALLDCYANGEMLSPDQIQSRIDRALMHRDLLLDALIKRSV
ncbi:Polysaccharide pyruvyl transferase superfamily [Synechococcus sp. PCC 7335]|uniref:polysaccharide pyruvyl transferase CsaB n=1 Tax=Synechococcus sp. (strain ATCC 29403 / PCC 7335) TaxID=91464 RepID=UPI00017EB0E7|nr:polysaccharide pyruvyl transferase CsaB [Synechococcus sp. PCC 7335]EDX83826.1 Polysaccharide pyruvyl transferase superfamily [Synechococcus sp. PCC 7335]